MEKMSEVKEQKPHAVCIPFPVQGHINPMLKLAKILHSKNFHVTFVNTEYNHNRLMRSGGPTAVAGLPSFQFETIPDGLPETDGESTQDPNLLCVAIEQNLLSPFKGLIARLNEAAGDVPPVSCIVSDMAMYFTVDAAEEFELPMVMLWTSSVCGLLGFAQFPKLIDLGIIPFKDENFTRNGDLEHVLDWIPDMPNIQLKDLPTPLRTTNPNDLMLKALLKLLPNSKKASAILFNSFEALDHHILQSLSSDFPPFYTLGPLQLLLDSIGPNHEDVKTKSISTNLWKEDEHCLKWLDSFEPNSVVYVNFGSITVMTKDQYTEFAWGLANSNQRFLWITRPNLIVSGESVVLPPEFLEETKDRGLIASWCDQEQVLAHSAIGGFLTHCGWNSALESISNGVPMICWPFFAEQQTNCWFSCNKWGIGMEIDANVMRSEVERQVQELMRGENGTKMKQKVMELRKLSHEAVVAPNGSSYKNLDKVIKILGSLS